MFMEKGTQLANETIVSYDEIIEEKFNALLQKLARLSDAQLLEVRRAFELARDAHSGVRRKSGEPYILHPIEVAEIVVSEMALEDGTSVICALLHDVVEDTNIELDYIEREFGLKVREIINGLTKISGSEVLSKSIDKLRSNQAENFRKILLTISDDIRVVLIKLADRLHNLRTMGVMKKEKILKKTSETLYIYAPLAHRLGLYEIKSEMEDLALKLSQPLIYRDLQKRIKATQDEAQGYIDEFIDKVSTHLKQTGLGFTVKSRFKTVFSVYAKMKRKKLPFEEIFDLYAIRIILESREGSEKADCWYVYALLSSIFRPNPKRIRDWITVPKANGYESLHTTLMGPQGKWVEVQIRTERMDDIAEKGVAAHWKYKENGEIHDDFFTEWIGQVRNILENPSLDALEALREFKEKLQPDDVFVFTPKGEMIRLPQNATVLDFAYKIHSNIGDTAIGAKVNNQVVTLDSVLRPGDQVEVLTSRKQRPKEEWLRQVITARAKNSIKNSLRKMRKDAIEKGRRIFKWRARRYSIDEDHPYMKELLAFFMVPSMDEFYFRLGTRQVNIARISDFIKIKEEGKEVESEYIKEWERKSKWLEKSLESQGVDPSTLVTGLEQNIDNRVLASCCNPVPGDDILGYDQKNTIVIHRTSCEQAIQLMSEYGDKIIRAQWKDSPGEAITFLSGIKVVGLDKQGMLHELIRIITMQMKINIRKVSIESQDGLFEGLFTIYVHNTTELEEVMERIAHIPHVYSVGRASSRALPFDFGLQKGDK